MTQTPTQPLTSDYLEERVQDFVTELNRFLSAEYFGAEPPQDGELDGCSKFLLSQEAENVLGVKPGDYTGEDEVVHAGSCDCWDCWNEERKQDEQAQAIGDMRKENADKMDAILREKEAEAKRNLKIVRQDELPSCSHPDTMLPHPPQSEENTEPYVEENLWTGEVRDSDPVNHPEHYTYGEIEVIDAIEDWGLSYHLGNAVKYIARCNHKHNKTEDLEKAIWYLQRELNR